MDKNIQSLLNSSYPVKIIVADNCSTDDTVSVVEKYPEVTFLKMTSNLGFGKANNIGIKEALENGADYVFLLNQDAWVFNDTVGNLIQVMERDTDVGLVSPMHYIADEVTLDSNFKTYLDRGVPFQNSQSLIQVTFVNAAAWMLSRECIEKTGYFEPLFGHYGEDRNYCDRVLYHGFSIVINEYSKIVHDRVITRNFKKDIIQCRYKVLTTLLNINHGLAKSYMLGLKDVLGLPKYFSKFYGFGKSVKLFFNLFGYYIGLMFKSGQIITARNNAK